jgi:hypothetical protein
LRVVLLAACFRTVPVADQFEVSEYAWAIVTGLLQELRVETTDTEPCLQFCRSLANAVSHCKGNVAA